MIMLILRHAWLNLWDKHMTTGRINQVSKIQGPGTFAPELESIDELDSCYKCVQIEIWTQRILLSSHISSSYRRINELRRAETFCPKLLDHATSVLPLIANRCETWDSSKVQIQILKHFAIPKNCEIFEKAAFANSHPSPEKTERLECYIGILFQCEDLQFRRIRISSNLLYMLHILWALNLWCRVSCTRELPFWVESPKTCLILNIAGSLQK